MAVGRTHGAVLGLRDPRDPVRAGLRRLHLGAAHADARRGGAPAPDVRRGPGQRRRVGDSQRQGPVPAAVRVPALDRRAEEAIGQSARGEEGGPEEDGSEELERDSPIDRARSRVKALAIHIRMHLDGELRKLRDRGASIT